MPTISDVAKRAGVSPATVSRVMQGAKNVSPATRERVEEAIEELGYVPSAVAQSLRSKRTRSLALVVSDITNTFWTTVARGVEDTAQARGYSLLLCNSDENPAKQQQYLDFLISQQVDGIIIAPYSFDAGHLDKLRARNIPTVVVDRRIEGWDVDSVCSDSISGARALVRHLIELGHRRIAVLSGPALTSTAEDRVAGYCMAMVEAGLTLDPCLIRRGEYRSTAGEELTHQVLDEGLEPTAIFAANNLIAMGVIDALEARGLAIPQDIALVSFDDLPNASRLFPFLTVVAQPVYDMGLNAAQLLLSRLDSEGPLRPRHVVLPVRLIVRHSCGSTLKDNGHSPLSLPISQSGLRHSTMVKPLSPEKQRVLARCLTGVTTPALSAQGRLREYDRSDVNRLLKALQHQEADRVPHLEFSVSSKAVYEYVLEHELEEDPTEMMISGLPVTPEDHVEFALRLGMDAVPCNLPWRPRYASGKVGSADDLAPPPSLASQLSYLERYLRAAQGTGVGVIARLSSFFGNALLAAGVSRTPGRLEEEQTEVVRLMETFLKRQERVMRAICDRFGEDLALVMVNERIADGRGLMTDPDTFLALFPARMEQLLAAAKEHGKLTMMHTAGKLNGVLPLLYQIGFDAVHPLEHAHNDIFELKGQWAGRIALVGNVPVTLLEHGNRTEIEKMVQEYCTKLAPGGGYVLSSSGEIRDGIPPVSLVAMTRAVHKYGRYGSLGREA